MSTVLSRRIINITSFCGLLAAIVLTIYGMQLGIFKDATILQSLVLKIGIWGPLLFVLVQIIQVVIPIIPGGISCAAGVLIFGPVMGFVYNYVGIVIGSFINFFLARQYGKPLIHGLVSDKTYNKYIGWLDDGRRFHILFAAAIFFPVAPDDVLCLIAGISTMRFSTFAAIILLGKPFSIFLYSLALVYGGNFLFQFL